MEKNIAGKVIVITGGAQGIGYAIAEAFLAEDPKTVLILDNNEIKGLEAEQKLNNKCKKTKAVFIKCDVTKDLEDVSRKIFDIYKRVDVLINNAGITDENSPRKVLEINSLALIEWSLNFWNHMRNDKAGKGGTIINIGSVYSYCIDPFLALYKASKYAVMGFSRTLGHEFNYNLYGVRVIILCPGITLTNMITEIEPFKEQTKEFEKHLNDHPKQSAEDVGKAAVHVFQTGGTGTAWAVINATVEQVQ